MSKTNFLNYINEVALKSRFNKTVLAERAKVSRVTFHKLLNGEIDEAKMSTMVNLAHALEVHPVELMKRYFSTDTEHRAQSSFARNRG